MKEMSEHIEHVMERAGFLESHRDLVRSWTDAAYYAGLMQYEASLAKGGFIALLVGFAFGWGIFG